jgi:DNA-binding transcriptional regulator/RsmH inhibitor MraZ
MQVETIDRKNERILLPSNTSKSLGNSEAILVNTASVSSPGIWVKSILAI